METWYMAGVLAVIVLLIAYGRMTRVRREAKEKMARKAASKAKRSASAKAAAARKVDLPMTEEQMARAQNMGMSGANSKGMQNLNANISSDIGGNGQYGRREL